LTETQRDISRTFLAVLFFIATIERLGVLHCLGDMTATQMLESMTTNPFEVVDANRHRDN
jgi:hypothetical protein